ncbi:MAG TPA: hypothetical protein VNX21_00685, partial [Candidatus Thermoplasmatota archaeon]|nr:hypothetical protein [Candidatus Thermoplasmatota archaeon]
LLRVAFWRPARRFVAGLRAAGPTRVTRDEVDWFGNRVVTVENASGAWRVHAFTGTRARLEVQGPRMAAPVRVRGDARAAGREAAALGEVPARRAAR